MITTGNNNNEEKLLELANILQDIAVALKEIVLAMTPQQRTDLSKKMENKSAL